MSNEHAATVGQGDPDRAKRLGLDELLEVVCTPRSRHPIVDSPDPADRGLAITAGLEAAGPSRRPIHADIGSCERR